MKRMNRLQNIEFRSQLTYDLPTYKEFVKGTKNMIPSSVFVQVIFTVYLAAYVFMIPFMGDFAFFPWTAAFLLILYGISKLITRKGGLQYKQMLTANGGLVPRNQLTISEGTIYAENMDNGNKVTYRFEQIRGIGETKNLILVLLEHRLGLAIDKRTLTGGTAEELKRYLLTSCPRLKKHRVQSGTGGCVRKGIIIALLFIGILLSLIQRVSGGSAFAGQDVYEERRFVVENEMNQLTYQEIAANLTRLGIGGITEEMADRLQSDWEQEPEENRKYMDKAASLLTELGGGSYDQNTWTWTPSSADVYAFDMEFFNLKTMYEDFLWGVAAIGDGELEFSDIEENLESVDWDNGTGSRSVNFKWKGEEYSLEANVMSDWFDFALADELNQIIAAESGGKQLYFGSDGYQMIYVFYCDGEWANAFTAVTGIQLTGNLNG